LLAVNFTTKLLAMTTSLERLQDEEK